MRMRVCACVRVGRGGRKRGAGRRLAVPSGGVFASPLCFLVHPEGALSSPSHAPARPLPQVTTLAAHAYHKASGRRPADPNQRLDYTENFMFMLDGGPSPTYRPNPRLWKALVSTPPHISPYSGRPW